MKIYQVLKLFQKEKYRTCLYYLKKFYMQNPYQPLIYLMFFLVYKKLKKPKMVLKWLKEGFYLLPENKKIAELYAYYCVFYKKNTEEALIPINRLTGEKNPGPLTHMTLSHFYYKKGDLERAFLYSKTALNENKSSLFQNWHVFLLFKYQRMSDLRKINKNCLARKLTGTVCIKDLDELRHSYEKRMALQEMGFLLLDHRNIRSPLYQLEIYRKYGFLLPKIHPLAMIQVLKENNIDILSEFEKKKDKKSQFFDENLTAIIVWFLIFFVIVLLIWRTFW